MQQVGFSYIDLEDRTGTIYGIHPYVFMETSYVGYHPNYDNIDLVLRSLMDPTIADVTVLSPSNEDKVKYGIMDKTVNPDGSVSYSYNSAYTLSFDRTIIEENTGEKIDVNQTLYISKRNERGNYYVFTLIRFLDATSESILQGVTLDTICEVSESSLKCLTFNGEDWIYPGFAEINISNTQRIELSSSSYSAWYDIIYATIGDGVSVMQIQYKDSTMSEVGATFHGITFKDASGNSWYVTPSAIKVYAPDGTELKPNTRRYDHNIYGEQVQVMDGYAQSADGIKVKVSANYVYVISGGKTETYLRYENSSFKKLFGVITSLKITENYNISEEDEKALLADPSKHQLTVKVTDIENNEFTYNFYSVTSRKSYLTIGEGENQVGGFYVQSTRIAKILSDAKKFVAGETLDPNANK